ncbi:MAG: cytochrome c biogenesis protein CcdA, partial [Chloroflexi bacterium]|nr:cytochrome c biogenesis protein CcdA [Chloroflexota bacterium]
MGELQQLAIGWMQALVSLLPIGYAFGAGMVSAVNPCGFAMLPAYLSLYLGTQDGGFAERSVASRALQAVIVGLAVSTGFVLLFAVVGAVISAGGRSLMAAMPWVGTFIGLGLVVLGVAMLFGRTIYASAFERLASRIGDPKAVTLRGFFLFGVAYGAASLSCTLPVFLVVVGSALTSGGFQQGVSQFLSYALGMSLVLMTLTLALALFKHGMVARLRQAVPYVQRAAAVLLLFAGSYIIFYWLGEGGLLRTLAGGAS